jgi:uncharacterized protein YbgA (DUF1722 family)
MVKIDNFNIKKLLRSIKRKKRTWFDDDFEDYKKEFEEHKKNSDKYIEDQNVLLIVQVNGKVRDKINASAGILQKEAEESKGVKGKDINYYTTALIKALNEVEEEGKSLENLIDPLNKEIEKLALQEQELYRKIKEKHFNLTDEQIIESVKNRLIKENLS